VKLQCAAALEEARRIEGTMEMEGMDGKGGKEGKEMGVRARLGYLSSAPPPELLNTPLYYSIWLAQEIVEQL